MGHTFFFIFFFLPGRVSEHCAGEEGARYQAWWMGGEGTIVVYMQALRTFLCVFL